MEFSTTFFVTLTARVRHTNRRIDHSFSLFKIKFLMSLSELIATVTLVITFLNRSACFEREMTIQVSLN